jgi:hypothetical protein
VWACYYCCISACQWKRKVEDVIDWKSYRADGIHDNFSFGPVSDSCKPNQIVGISMFSFEPRKLSDLQGSESQADPVIWALGDLGPEPVFEVGY